MKLVCKNCGVDFELRNAEYNRQVKRGRDKDHFFCKQGCATSFSNRNAKYVLTEARIKHLDSIRDLAKKAPILSADDERAFTYCINKCRGRTKERNLRGRNHEMDIDTAYLKQLWFDQGGKCALSGIDMRLKHNTNKIDNHPFLASIDRIDSSIGYVKGNVRFICLMANFALSTWGDEQLFDFCTAVANNVSRQH